MSLQLVSQGLTGRGDVHGRRRNGAAIRNFDKKAILIERGSFGRDLCNQRHVGRRATASS